MLVLDAKVRRRLWVWGAFLSLMTIAIGIWYAVSGIRLGELPGSSTPPGLVCGIAAGLLFVFESLLILRKTPWFRTKRWLGTARLWLEVHIFLGILTLPLVFFHTRLLSQWGGGLTIAVTAIFLAVYASGIYGLVLQHLLPRRLLQTIPEETIRSQIDRLRDHLRLEAELLVFATCGPPEGEPLVPEAVLTDEHRAIIRAARKGAGAGLLRRLPPTELAGAQVLWTAFRREIEPFLREGFSDSVLCGRGGAAERFRDLKTRIDPAAHDAVDTLESLCEQRRQLSEQARLHDRLHRWLWFHLLLSISLLAVTAWHATTAVIYW
jgi:hypothetical protein